MKFAVALVCLSALVAVNAQFSFMGLGGGGAFPPSQFYQMLLERQLEKLLLTPDFPEDLQERAIATVANAQTGFDTCNSAAYPMTWMQKVCITRQYSAGKTALTAIESEATARAQASAVPQTEVEDDEV